MGRTLEPEFLRYLNPVATAPGSDTDGVEYFLCEAAFVRCHGLRL